MDKIDSFEKRLNDFIDKYYRNQFIKGLVLIIFLTAIIILLTSTIEYFSWFKPKGRFVLFTFSIVSILFILNYFLFVPILKYFGILKRITYKRTVSIIEHNIPELKDYLSNIIELKFDNSDFNNIDLLNAAIFQKIKITESYNFKSVIKLQKLVPILNYLGTLIIIYVLIFSIKPDIIIDGSKRVLHFNREFERKIGYKIFIDEKLLTIEQGKDLDFSVKIEGSETPRYLDYFIGNNEYLLKKINNKRFQANIKNVNKSFSFRIGNDEFKSKAYNVKIIKPPYLKGYKVNIFYPKYIGLENVEYDNISNFKLPIGTTIRFDLELRNTDSIVFFDNGDSTQFFIENNFYSIKKDLTKSIAYFISACNKNLNKVIIPRSFINVIPDLYPEISVEQVNDEFNKKIFYFKGNISDDYGFSSLKFIVNKKEFEIPIQKNNRNQEFYFSYEFAEGPNSKEVYYFEIFDNDAINGYKGKKSGNFIFEFPDVNKLISEKDEKNKEIFKKLEKSRILVDEFKRDITDLKSKMFSENLSDFEKKQIFNSLIEKQESLQQLMNELTKENQIKNTEFDSFSEVNNELLKKQNDIQKLLEGVMDDDLKNLLDELRKLKESINKEDLNNNLDKLELNYKDLGEQLDKNFQLLKKYEIEKDLNLISKELKDFSKKQNDLANKVQIPIDSLINKSSKKANDLENQFEQTYEKNNSLEHPMKINDLKEDFKELSREAENVLDKNLASEQKEQKLRDNSDQAKKLANKIDKMLNNNRSNENAENADVLRQILENLIYFSFKQEEIIKDFSYVSENSPKFNDIVKEQNDLNKKFDIIRDSLIALSKRTTYLGNHIAKKTFEIQEGLFDADILVNDKKINAANLKQRYLMESANDLILLLSESLKNMDNASGQGGGSSKSKNRAKQSKPSLSEMRKSQESLKEELEQLIKKMKEGGSSGSDGKKFNEKLGKSLAEQEILQQMINQLENNNSIERDVAKQLNEIKNLIEQNKRDFVNRRVDRNTLNRQKEIVTRLLESEKAEMQRETDDKRKSEEALKYEISNPRKIFDEDERNENFNDILNKNSLKLNYFYKNKYQEYLKKLN